MRRLLLAIDGATIDSATLLALPNGVVAGTPEAAMFSSLIGGVGEIVHDPKLLSQLFADDPDVFDAAASAE